MSCLASYRRVIGPALGLLLASVVPVVAATEVSMRLSAARIEAGSVVSLFVTVSEPNGRVADPQFTLAAGLELLGSSREQQMSWVNGKATNQVTFRYAVGATLPGRYRIGPVRVTVGSQTYRSEDLPLTVSNASRSTTLGTRGRASNVASLVVTLDPPAPVVGQACRLRVQLVQRVDMSEDSDYAPPATPGFWSESWGDASTYEAHEGNRKVWITERSLRLYPLAPGRAVISPAHAMVTPQASGLLDPFGSLRSEHVTLSSDSLHVGVRPLPSSPPQGFDGGVGQLEPSWSADRSHTTQDQAITARLDVRGVGNLPLLRAPAYAPADFEVFASTVEDSLPPAGVLSAGRRTFVWTLLPRRSGHLKVPSPTLQWYDPAAARYVSSAPASLALEVLSPRSGAGGEDADGLPAVFRAHPSRPGGRVAWSLLALLGGALVAVSVGLARDSQAPDPGAAARARQREWLRSVGLTHGPDFWRAADEAASWLQERGEQVLRLREAIAAARYGGRVDQEDEVRRRLVERLSASMPAPRPRWPLQTAAVVVAAGGLVLGVWAAPRAGPASLAQRATSADTRARAGHVEQAEAEWTRLWDEGPGDPALAARLAWGALSRDDVGAATVWTLRGERVEARDASLSAMTARVRDAGGLVGAPGRALPLRSWEWALLAFVLAAASGLSWQQRRWALGLFALAMVAGAWWPVENAWRTRQPLAVVRSSIALPPVGVLLDAGQVVRVRKRGPSDAEVRAASDLEGTLPVGALWFLEAR